MKKIALFGTSADPPTAGHQSILRWLALHYDLVVVWASDNPFKQHQTPLSRRSEMLRLVIEEIEVPKNNISLYQQLSDRYTLVTVNKAREIWGDNAEFTLVIGADILPQISSWYRIEELLAKVKVLIVPRSGYEIDRADLKTLKDLGGEYTIASLDAPQVSSSAYRDRKDNKIITPAVENYISQKDLYAAKTQIKAEEKV